MRRLLLLLVLALPAASLAAQQRLGAVLKRPKLAAGSDTNDARTYLNFATRAVEGDPEGAASGFYWAARLDPASAEALYGLRIAHLMRRPQTLRLYLEGSRRARNDKYLKSLDSLSMRASRLDPFLYRRWDKALIVAYYRNLILADYPNASRAEVDHLIVSSLERSDFATRAWVAYSEGRMPAAVTAYTEAIKSSKHPAGLRIDKGRAHFMQGHIVPALAEFRLALEALQEEEKDPEEKVIFYNSKALVEHASAIIFNKMAELDSAKAALGRAMTEDLAYFMAHVELGRLALASKDSVTAVSELGLAAELATDEPWVHYLHGSTLVAVGQHADGITALKKAVALEPIYAAPHLSLAQALEKAGDLGTARDAYFSYMRLSAKRDEGGRHIATTRLAALGYPVP